MATTSKCYTTTEISQLNGFLNENQDGTVSVFVPNNLGELAPVILTQQCCRVLNPNYIFDIENQKCLWTTSPTTDCKITDVFKIALNPQGNDGVILNFGSNDNCVLDVSFDYLFKIKCETLNEILINGANTDYSDINPQLYNQIINLQQLIEQQLVECETINNKITLLNEEINNSFYSVTCDFNTSVGDESDSSVKGRIVSNSLTAFDKTGFGLNSEPQKLPSRDIKLPSDPFKDVLTNRTNIIPNRITYCISEPNGLEAWENILGSSNYQGFLNGNPSSYDCDDVSELINQNSITINNGEEPLIFECDTPFGTKSDFFNQLSLLNFQLLQCQETVSDLQNQLSELQQQYDEELANSCIRPINIFESLDLAMTVDVLSGSTYQTVYEGTDFFPQIGFGNLYNHLVNNENSGFYVCGGPECSPMYLNLNGETPFNTSICQTIADNLIQTLFDESNLSGQTNGFETFSNSLSNSAFTSSWRTYQTTIDDENLLALMVDNKIRIGFKINYVCDDICILVDNIKLNKVCTNIDETNIFVTKSPGFELERIRDNKKSWIRNTTFVNRNFEILNHKGLNPIRQTNYNVEDDRLIINTKEIDLDVNLASAISTDVWNYISTNPCILTGETTCNPCEIIGFETIQIFDNQPATSYGTFLTAYTGSKSSSYNNLGTAFYKSNLTGKIPYSLATTGLSDSDSTVITSDVVVIGNNLWSANGSNANGRLNNTGIWATQGAPNPNEPENEWIGFSKCINLTTSGVYSIGLAADNNARFKINGELFYDANIVDTSTFTYWRVFEVTLSAGTNVIEMEGRNDDFLASFGAEIYQADIATLSAMTTSSQLNNVIVFSTKDFRYETNGNIPVVFDLGQDSGYSCPVGYFLNKCGTGVTCSFLSIETIPIYQKCCGDNLIEFDNLLTTPLSSITVVEDFEYIISSELIDAKNRQTISSYPTLKALYHRYMNSSEYCDTISSAFDYQSMDQFAGLIGSYWVDLIEQVIPSTTIWGSVKIYSNTIFDQQKFKYKSYSTLLCKNPFSGISVSSPINGTDGETENIEVMITNINISPNSKSFPTKCTQLHVAQMNHGSEFIGTVNILGDEGDNCDTQDTTINECALQLSVNIDGVTVTPNVIGATAPVTYLWSNGDTGSTTTFPSGGTQSLTVTDANCCTATVRFFVNHLTACWYTLPDSNFFLTSGIFNPVIGITGYTYIMENMIVNGVEYVTGPEPTYVLNDSNLNLIPTNDGELTYTNFVTFLNQAFTTLGLTEYSAQISLNNDDMRPSNIIDKYNGFYIIRPIVDTFYIYVREDDNADTTYTNTSTTPTISGTGGRSYRGINCNNIVVNNNGVVIE